MLCSNKSFITASALRAGWLRAFLCCWNVFHQYCCHLFPSLALWSPLRLTSYTLVLFEQAVLRSAGSHWILGTSRGKPPPPPRVSVWTFHTHQIRSVGCSGEMMSQRELNIGSGFGLVMVHIKVLWAWTDDRNHLWSHDVMGAHTRLVLLRGVSWEELHITSEQVLLLPWETILKPKFNGLMFGLVCARLQPSSLCCVSWLYFKCKTGYSTGTLHALCDIAIVSIRRDHWTWFTEI